MPHLVLDRPYEGAPRLAYVCRFWNAKKENRDNTLTPVLFIANSIE
jgi:hypothetical protein